MTATAPLPSPIRWIRHYLIPIGFLPILAAVLGADSMQLAGLGYHTQWLADGLAIAYFGLMLWGLRPQERWIAIAFVPFSAVAEYLFSQVFELYLYRLGMVPLYVPFGHAILFSTGLVLTDLIGAQRQTLRWGLLTLHLLLFTVAIALWHDGLSAILALIFAWIVQRKGVRLLYGVMGVLVLMVELIGTSLGCWVWEPSMWGWLHTTNPPVGAFVFYVLGDLAGFKLGRWAQRLQLNFEMSGY